MKYPRMPPWLAAAAAATCVLVAFAEPAVTVFGTADNYAFFVEHRLDGVRAVQTTAADGRLLHGVLYDAMASLCTTFVDTTHFRIAYVAGLLLLALAFARVLEASGMARWPAAAAATFACASTAHLDLLALDPSWSVPLGELCALGAWVLWGAPAAGPRRALRVALAALLLALATSIYTLAPFFFFAPLTAALTLQRGSATERFAALARSTLFFGVVVVSTAVLSLRVLAPLVGATDRERAALTHAPLMKLGAFVAFPVRQALLGPLVQLDDPLLGVHRQALHAGAFQLHAALVDVLALPLTWVALLVAVVITVSQLRRRRSAPDVLFAAACIVLAGGVHLPLALLWMPPRVSVAMTAVVGVLLGAALAQVHNATVQRTLALLLMAGCAVAVAVNGHRLVAAPLACEWETLLDDVAVQPEARALAVVPAAATQATAFELGRPAGASPWAPVAMVRLARHALGLPQIPVRKVEAKAELGEEDESFIRLGCRAHGPAGFSADAF